jgi:glycosyltransferase involved in cell wall biosynthesis
VNPLSDIRVLILTNATTGGGAEISMMNLFESLRVNLARVELCAINEVEMSALLPTGVTVLGRKWHSGFGETIKNVKIFREFMRKFKFDIVVANCELPELYVALACVRKQNIIVVEHTSRPWDGRMKLGFLIRFILKLRNVKWVTVNSSQKSIWPFKSYAGYIPNPYVSLGEKKNSESSDLVFVGRLNKGKHPEIAAKAAASVGVSIHFYGDGVLLEALRSEFETDNCKFFGFKPDPWRLISKSAVLVIPSEYEGDGMTVVEGILNNNPILLADNDDLRRFKLPNQNYFSNIEELISKIQDIKKRGPQVFLPPLQLTANLREERDISNISKQWLAKFKEIVNEIK